MTRAIKRTILYLGGVALVILVIDLSGVFRHPFELDYFSEFSYPLDLPNFPSVVRRYGRKELTAYDPMNHLYANITFLKTANQGGCTPSNDDPFRLIFVVKSAPQNFAKRSAIRLTWGHPRRFSDVPIKTVFLLGSPSQEHKTIFSANPPHPHSTLEDEILVESEKYRDLIQGNFIDGYYNNTYKTLMGMRWLAENCSNFRYSFFSDDDMYVSTKNLLKFLRHPTAYPEYWENQKKLDRMRVERHFQLEKLAKKRNKLNHNNQGQQPTGPKGLPSDQRQPKLLQQENAVFNEHTGQIQVWKNNPLDFDIELEEDTDLYAGYVYFLPPYRHKLGSKWYLALSEYPYNYLPPFVPAGSLALSKSTLLDIYYASLFTKHLRFDDVFIALCAKKMGIEPFHSEYFRVSPSYPVMDRDDIKLEYLITWHGFDDPDTLMRFWNAQKSLGNA